MNFKKIAAAFAAAAMAVTTMAVSAFAATVDIDSEFPGAWTSSGRGITKAELEAVGGDVKIVLTVQTRNLANTADQFLVNPIDYDNGWVSQTVEHCTSDSLTAKVDGWICVRESDTSLEFVYDKDAIAALGDSGLCFSVQNVIVKSAEYTLADGPQGQINFVDDKTGKEYCFSTPEEAAPAEEAAETASEETAAVEEAAPADEAAATSEEAAPAVEESAPAAAEEAPAAAEEAPAAVPATTSAATGNTSAAAIAAVMALAGAAAVVSKRK